MKIKTFLLFLGLFIFSNGCRIPLAGSHGSMGDEARYSMTKTELEKHILRTIYASNDLVLIPTEDSIFFSNDRVKEAGVKEDWIVLHNAYITVGIKFEGVWYDVVFRYYGDKEYWKTSATAAIFMCYIREKGGKKYKCYYDFNFSSHNEEKYLIAVFEKGFVAKLNKEVIDSNDI